MLYVISPNEKEPSSRYPYLHILSPWGESCTSRLPPPSWLYISSLRYPINAELLGLLVSWRLTNVNGHFCPLELWLLPPMKLWQVTK